MQTDEKLYRYLDSSGCFKRVVVILVDGSGCFGAPCRCDQSGIHPGIYEVYARGRSITPMAETWTVDIYFHTGDRVASQQMLELFAVGNVLQAQGNIWSMCDGGFTLYVDGLAEVVRVPDDVEKHYKHALCAMT